MFMYIENDVSMSLLYLWTSLYLASQLNWRSWDMTLSGLMLLNLWFGGCIMLIL